jgi:hypothetical protein
MSNKKSTLTYRTDLVNIGIGQGQRETVPYLHSQTDYNEDGKVIMQCSYAQGEILSEKVVYEYDESGNVIHEIYFVEEDEPSEEKSYEYGEDNKIVRQHKHYQDGSADITDFRYNAEGLLIETVTLNDEEEVEARETFEYSNGKVSLHIRFDGEGNPVFREEFEFDAEGKIVVQVRNDEESGEFFRLRIKYSPEGRKLAEMVYNEEDELVETTWFEEDEKGRVVQTVEENNRDKRIRRFNFDDRGNNLGYEEHNGRGDKMVVVEHLYDQQNHPVSSMVFINGAGRTMSQHYELRYEHRWE